MNIVFCLLWGVFRDSYFCEGVLVCINYFYNLEFVEVGLGNEEVYM